MEKVLESEDSSAMFKFEGCSGAKKLGDNRCEQDREYCRTLKIGKYANSINLGDGTNVSGRCQEASIHVFVHRLVAADIDQAAKHYK